MRFKSQVPWRAAPPHTSLFVVLHWVADAYWMNELWTDSWWGEFYRGDVNLHTFKCTGLSLEGFKTVFSYGTGPGCGCGFCVYVVCVLWVLCVLCVYVVCIPHRSWGYDCARLHMDCFLFRVGLVRFREQFLWIQSPEFLQDSYHHGCIRYFSVMFTVTWAYSQLLLKRPYFVFHN